MQGSGKPKDRSFTQALTIKQAFTTRPRSKEDIFYRGVLLVLGMAMIWILVFGFYMFYLCIWTIIDTNSFLSQPTASASGLVSHVTQSTPPVTSPSQISMTICSADITFQPPGGKSVTFRSDGGCTEGAKVSVLFNPHNPAHAYVESVMYRNVGAAVIGSILFMIVFISLLIQAIPRLMKKYKHARAQRRLH